MPLETVDNVHIFPGQAHRWLVDEGVGARRLLDVDEGRWGRCSGSTSTRAVALAEGLDVDEGMSDATGVGLRSVVFSVVRS